MNYFGHAAVAVWQSQDRGFVLGSMLPDFATMIAAHPPAAAHLEIEAGMRFHHRTDEVFHRSVVFRELAASAFAWLTAHGVRRASARAVAHIGVELALEAPLARDEAARRAYLAALDGAAEAELGQYVGWASGDERARFGRLREALVARGVATGDVAPDLVAQRLRRALARRPRLALDDAAEATVRDWVADACPAIAARVEPLVAELATHLR
jgi:hypothetical protein